MPTFRLFDPNAPNQLVAAGYVSPAPHRSAAAAPLVMIVDDSLTVRKITSRLLTREGFGVVTAKDGIDALQLLDVETPDVILLDIEMPRMDGFEFTKTIKGDPRKVAHPDRDDHVAHRGEAPQPRARSSASTSTSASRSRKRSCSRNLREMLALASLAAAGSCLNRVGRRCVPLVADL